MNLLCHVAAQRVLARLVVVVLAMTCLTGCVRRRLTVRSHPPGAQVFVDSQEIGTTPCSASFVYYGTRTIMVMKDGYKTETIHQPFYPPWYEIPPLDFFSENLSLRERRDERIVDIQLAPEEIVPQARLLERAQALRDGARTGQITLPSGAAIIQPVIGYPGQGLPGGEPIPRYPLPAPPGSTVLPSLSPTIEALPQNAISQPDGR